MKMKYLKTPKKEQLEAAIGQKVLQFVIGHIEVGTELVEDEGRPGQMIQLPITEPGIEIEVASLSATKQALLDAALARFGYQRLEG